MKITIEERLALLEAEVAELRAAAVAAGTSTTRGHVKEMLFYSTLEPGEEVLVDGVWETVQSIHDGGPNTVDIRFHSGVRVQWKKNREILRRAPKARLPEKANTVPRTVARSMRNR